MKKIAAKTILLSREATPFKNNVFGWKATSISFICTPSCEFVALCELQILLHSGWVLFMKQKILSLQEAPGSKSIKGIRMCDHSYVSGF